MEWMLTAGFALLIVGINLMVIWSMLADGMSASAIQRVRRVTRTLFVVGSIVFGIGIASGNQIILWTGTSAIVLGIASLIPAKGQGKERVVKTGAWVATVMGVGFILAYVVRLWCAC